MSTTKALEIEDRNGNVLRFEKEDGAQIEVTIIGSDHSGDSVELDETDRREVAEWLGLARG